jgi:hypothetical protein
MPAPDAPALRPEQARHGRQTRARAGGCRAADAMARGMRWEEPVTRGGWTWEQVAAEAP